MDETVKSALIDGVIALARSARSDVHLGEKYGGTVFMTDPDIAGSFVGGVFASKAHVSVEFSNGVAFRDPDGVLEGKGKARRHVKLRSLADIDDKDVAGFLAQALA
jgi:hypothetical protein